MTKRGRPRLDIAEPTPEQAREGRFAIGDIVDRNPGGSNATIGKAWRRVRMVEQLALQNLISAEEYKALKHYRHHADLADRSPIRDSLNHQRGHGAGPTISALNAVRIRDDCEKAAGSLVEILRAIVVDDTSLSQWAIQRHGGVEKRYVRGKNLQVVEIRPRDSALSMARMEIKIAAQRVQAELCA